MQKLKHVGLKGIRALMAFMFFLNGLAAFFNGLSGKRSQELWAPLGVAVGGFFILYISRPKVWQPLSARHQQWKRKTSENLAQVLLFWFGLWLILTCLAGAISWGLMSQTNLRKYQILAKQSKTTQGQIIAKESKKHQTVHYTYRVNKTVYEGLSYTSEYPLEKLKLNDKVLVFYNPTDPQVSMIGDPHLALQEEIAFHVSLPVIFPIFLLLIVFRRLLPMYRRSLPGKAA